MDEEKFSLKMPPLTRAKQKYLSQTTSSRKFSFTFIVNLNFGLICLI